MTALVLVGMSVSDVDRRTDLLALATSRGAGVAFLQMGDPSLSAELTRLADLGHRQITLVGVDTGPIAPGRSWLTRVAGHWWRERAGERPRILVADRLAKELAEFEDVLAHTSEISGGEAPLTSAAWEEVTGHRHQVMICRGPRCTARGQVDNLRAMVLAMVEHGLSDDDVLLVHTGCQFPCNQAPVISVQPDDVWYGAVDPTAARAIVTDHLVGDQPVEAVRLRRRRAERPDPADQS